MKHCETCGAEITATGRRKIQFAAIRFCTRKCIRWTNTPAAAIVIKQCATCGRDIPKLRKYSATRYAGLKFCSLKCIRGVGAAAPLQARFDAKVDRSGGPDACWPWTAARNKDGYGRIHKVWDHDADRQIETGAHRVAWELANGKDPGDRLVLHRCDNPPCCNPAHLFLGTNQENMADRNAKHRQMRGERQHLAKLTAADVVEIRRSHESALALAKRIGVSRASVYSVRSGHTWKHVSVDRTMESSDAE